MRYMAVVPSNPPTAMGPRRVEHAAAEVLRRHERRARDAAPGDSRGVLRDNRNRSGIVPAL